MDGIGISPCWVLQRGYGLHGTSDNWGGLTCFSTFMRLSDAAVGRFLTTSCGMVIVDNAGLILPPSAREESAKNFPACSKDGVEELAMGNGVGQEVKPSLIMRGGNAEPSLSGALEGVMEIWLVNGGLDFQGGECISRPVGIKIR